MPMKPIGPASDTAAAVASDALRNAMRCERATSTPRVAAASAPTLSRFSEDGSSVHGIVSERDVVRRLQEDESVLDNPVSAIMTADVRTCTGDQRVNDLMEIMTSGRFRHIPVVDEGRLTGIVSIGDVVKNRMSELEFERDQLDNYLHQT